MKNTFNAIRLKEARILRKMTIEELAEATEIKKQSVSQFENEKCAPDFNTIKRISEILDFPIAFFYEKIEPNVIVGNTYFRALFSSNKKDMNSQRIRTKLVIECYHYLNRLINFVPLNLPNTDGITDIEELAQAVRNHWNLGEEPIQNVIGLLESNGIIITEYATEAESIDAFSQYCEIDGNGYYCIILGTEKESFVRRQFSCAHELGHILLHEKFDDLNDINREEYRQREIEANLFASAFLLPRDSFLKDLRTFGNRINYYIELKKKWGVSISSMIMRANSLGVINDNQYQYLWRKININNWRKEEPLDDKFILRHPRYLRHAIHLLKEERGMTGSQILKIFYDNNLSLPRKVVEDILCLEKDYLIDPTSDSKVLLFPKLK